MLSRLSDAIHNACRPGQAKSCAGFSGRPISFPLLLSLADLRQNRVTLIAATVLRAARSYRRGCWCCSYRTYHGSARTHVSSKSQKEGYTHRPITAHQLSRSRPAHSAVWRARVVQYSESSARHLHCVLLQRGQPSSRTTGTVLSEDALDTRDTPISLSVFPSPSGTTLVRKSTVDGMRRKMGVKPIFPPPPPPSPPSPCKKNDKSTIFIIQRTFAIGSGKG